MIGRLRVKFRQNSFFFLLTAKVQVTAESCEDLFASGIRMHGTYTVKNGTKIQCNFKGKFNF